MARIRRESLLVKEGMKFGKLTVIGPAYRHEKWNAYVSDVRCECGTVKPALIGRMLSGKTVSCGCHRDDQLKAGTNRTHGDSKTVLYRVWCGMRERCQNEGHKTYEQYGGRGISVCPEWDASYEAFKEWALANGYKSGLEIDRADNSSGYSPENCRFVTHQENCNNRDTNLLITAFGETKNATQWAADPRCKIPRRTLSRRILKFGWPAELAITTPAVRGMNRPK